MARRRVAGAALAQRQQSVGALGASGVCGVGLGGGWVPGAPGATGAHVVGRHMPLVLTLEHTLVAPAEVGSRYLPTFHTLSFSVHIHSHFYFTFTP